MNRALKYEHFEGYFEVTSHICQKMLLMTSC